MKKEKSKKEIHPLIKERRRAMKQMFNGMLSKLPEDDRKFWMARFARMNRTDFWLVEKLFDSLTLRNYPDKVVERALTYDKSMLVTLRTIAENLHRASEPSERNDNPFSIYYDPDEDYDGHRIIEKPKKKSGLQSQILAKTKGMDEFEIADLASILPDIAQSNISTTLKKMDEFEKIKRGVYRRK